MTTHTTTHTRPSTFSSAAGMVPWMFNLATRMLAGALNMPEPVLHDTGVFVFAHVQAVEISVGKTLCPIRLLRPPLAPPDGAPIASRPPPTRQGEPP